MAEEVESNDKKPKKESFIKLCLWNCLHISRHTFIAFVITLAVFLSALRIILPGIDEYRHNIETAVSEALEKPVQIENIKAKWHRFGPHIELRGLKLLDNNKEKTLLYFEKALISINLLESLRQWNITLERLNLSIEMLDLQRDHEGGFLLKNLDLAPAEHDQDDRQGMEALRWLLAQDMINIDVKKLLWTDHLNNERKFIFQNARIEARNNDDHHQLSARISLPENLGEELLFAFDGFGDLTRPGSWSGRIYLEGTKIRPHKWLQTIAAQSPFTFTGTTDFKLWSHWRNSLPTSASGTVSGQNITVYKKRATKKQPFALDGFSANFSWLNKKDSFRLDVDKFTLQRNGFSWPFSQFSIEKNSSQSIPLYTLQASFLKLDDLRDLLLGSGLLDKKIAADLKAFHPGGQLSNVYLKYQKEEPQQFRFRAEFANLATRFRHPFPGIQNLSGHISINPADGTLYIDSRSLELDSGSLFRNRLPLELLYGKLDWKKSATAWRIKADDIVLENRDIRARGSMFLELPQDKSPPFLEILANFADGDAKQLSRYLPAGIMPPKAVDWLDKSIVDGRVTHGSVLFHGPLEGFPFRDNQGSFEVYFHVENGILDYLENWPRLERLQLEAAFNGPGMEINVTAGELLQSHLYGVNAFIADFRDKPINLTVDGYIDGPLDDSLQLLRTSPLKGRFGDFAKSSAATGNSRTHLQLNLPIAPEGHRVNGKISFDNNTLTIAGGAVDLKQLQGALTYSEKGISSSGIKGELFGMETEVVIRTYHDDDEGSLIQFSAEGKANARQISRLIHLPSDNDFLKGKTDWQARLQLAFQSGENGPPDINLYVDSNLKGLAVTLPYPLEKQALEKRDFSLKMGLLGQALTEPVAIRYGGQINGIFLRDTSKESLVWQRGEIRLGDSHAATLPLEPRLRIVGDLPKLSISNWMKFLPKQQETDSNINLPDDIDLHIASMEALGQHFEQTSIVVDRTAHAWNVDIDSPQIKGLISLPRQDDLPVIMNLEYLQITSGEEEEEDHSPSHKASPEKIPALQISSQKLVFNGNDFGSLNLTATPRKDGLHFETVTLVSPHTKIEASGDWFNIDNTQKTDFDVTLQTKQLPKTLALFDTAIPVTGGNGQVKINADWLGSPTEFDLTKINGRLNMSIRDGQLTEVKPGAGRIVSLLSLQALPKRLLLDFRDLFAKGFKFDLISGDYKIDMGNAFTENMLITSSAAEIKVAGRIGLADEDYNQQVLVTPKVSSILPVAGAIAAGSSWMGAGAAVLIFQKVFLPKFDTIARTEYRITGSWDDPVIEKVSVDKVSTSKQAQQKQ